jgi:hypothetical protein
VRKGASVSINILVNGILAAVSAISEAFLNVTIQLKLIIALGDISKHFLAKSKFSEKQ